MKRTPKHLAQKINKVYDDFNKNAKAIVQRFDKADKEMNCYLKAVDELEQAFVISSYTLANRFPKFQKRLAEMWAKWKIKRDRYTKDMRPHCLTRENKLRKIRASYPYFLS